MRTVIAIAFAALFAAASAPAQTSWKLLWSDEFNGPAGSQPDATKWNYDLGGGGWGNGEAETYTNSPNNVFQDGQGNLVIRAIRDASGNYTSARLQTGAPGASTQTTDLSWQYGRIEARIKLPFGKGVWPAFWMLGEDISTTPWPGSGEIDIMENFGTYNNNSTVNNGTAHGPGYSGGNGLGAPYTLPFGETVNDDYHVYAVEWSPYSIVWYVDGASYHTVTPVSLPAGAKWVFNAPFFLLLNLAIGGPTSFLGTPDASVTFPQDMLVDYVRVYQSTTIPTTTPVITPGRVVNAASYLGAISPGSLTTVCGNNLAAGGHSPLNADGSFPTSAAGVTVSVNGVNAPLIYVSPKQINFQVPWETAPGLAVPVKVTWNGVDSNVEPVTITPVSPSFFLSASVDGVAWVTGNVADGCATPLTECSVKAGSIYQLWANGLGPKTSPLQNGVAAPPVALPVSGGYGSCQLTIGGQPAQVSYCGAAPTLIIDQINFTYPAGVTATAPYVAATLTINGATGHFRVPAPLSSDQRADALLARMTQAQKLQFVAGAGGPNNNIPALPRGAGGYIPGIAALGIPALYFVDGSRGLAGSSAPSTALPSALASAASWDTDLAYKFGSVIGAETTAWGLNVNLGGNGILIGREPRDGRTFETKGDDPILAGKLTAAHIRAIQDRHVIGGAKHC